MRFLVLHFLFAAIALGASCEEQFSKAGNPFAGTRYTSSVRIANLSVADAVGQLHGIAVGRKLDILTEDAASGSMLLEDRMSMRHKAIPYVVSVAAEGGAAQVQLMVKLDKGAFAKAEDVKKEICSILALVKGGDEGKAAAEQGAAAVSTSGPRKVDALVLSMELARQTQESAESIPLRYKGKAFTVSGRVEYVIKDGEFYRVAYDIPEPRDMALQLGSLNPPFKINISCLMAPSQAAWSLALRKGEKVKLTGTFYDFDQFKKVMWLDGCKPE
jgi:hypothetical protein